MLFIFGRMGEWMHGLRIDNMYYIKFLNFRSTFPLWRLAEIWKSCQRFEANFGQLVVDDQW